MNKNLVYNKHCPICNSMEVIDKKKSSLNIVK